MNHRHIELILLLRVVVHRPRLGVPLLEPEPFDDVRPPHPRPHRDRPKLSVVICMVKHDDYMTPFSAWEDVSAYIPRHLTLWEAFYGDGTSGHHLTELGFDVIHEDLDFFAHDLGECVVTNPPFSELPRVLARLRELGKPFVVIMPCSTLTTRYFRDLFQDIQVIVPRKRIQFRKLVDGVEVPSGRCSFDCLYFCWRLGLPRDVVFLT